MALSLSPIPSTVNPITCGLMLNGVTSSLRLVAVTSRLTKATPEGANAASLSVD